MDDLKKHLFDLNMIPDPRMNYLKHQEVSKNAK